MTQLVSARVVQDGACVPALEAIAHGRLEQRLIFNRDEGVDSLLELVPLFGDGVDERELQLLAELCNGLSAHNQAQVALERAIAGWADALAGDLHRVELTGHSGLVGQQEIARRLRGALEVLRDVPVEVVQAVRTVDAVLAVVPRAQLQRGSVRNLLGAGKYRLLADLDHRGRSRWS